MNLLSLLNAAVVALVWAGSGVVVVTACARATALARRDICRLALLGVPVALLVAPALSVPSPGRGLLLLPPRGPAASAAPLSPATRPGDGEDRPTLAPRDDARRSPRRSSRRDDPSASTPPGAPNDRTGPEGYDGLPAIATSGQAPVCQADDSPGSASVVVPRSWPTLASGALWLPPAIAALGSLGLLVRLLRERVALWRWSRCWRPAAGRSVRLLAELSRHVGRGRPPKLRVAPGLDQPAVAGVLWPVVLLPEDLSDLDEAVLRGALAHELGHVLQRDPAWEAIGGIAVALAWWCPPVHWLSRRLRLEQDAAADDHAVLTGVAPGRLVTALTHFAQRNLAAAPAGLSGMSSNLVRRAQMILDNTTRRVRPAHRRFASSLTGLGGLVLLLALVQGPLVGVARADGDREGGRSAREEGREGRRAEREADRDERRGDRERGRDERHEGRADRRAEQRGERRGDREGDRAERRDDREDRREDRRADREERRERDREEASGGIDGKAGREIEKILRSRKEAMARLNRATAERLVGVARDLDRQGRREQAVAVLLLANSIDPEHRKVREILSDAGIRLERGDREQDGDRERDRAHRRDRDDDREHRGDRLGDRERDGDRSPNRRRREREDDEDDDDDDEDDDDDDDDDEDDDEDDDDDGEDAEEDDYDEDGEDD